jgi:hypothetical protein
LSLLKISSFALLALILLLCCVSGAGQSSPQPTLEGKWILTYDYRGQHRTRTFTFERDKKGRLVGTQNDPVCPCALLVHFKGGKLTMELTPPNPVKPEILVPSVMLGPPLSTIFEAKVSGDEMDGKFYLKGGNGETVNFKGARQTATEPSTSAPTK